MNATPHENRALRDLETSSGEKNRVNLKYSAEAGKLPGDEALQQRRMR